MPDDDVSEGTDGVADEAAFRERLGRLVGTAVSNGVDVRGSHPVLADERAGWDVEIVELSL
jgi:hypothetical protein